MSEPPGWVDPTASQLEEVEALRKRWLLLGWTLVAGVMWSGMGLVEGLRLGDWTRAAPFFACALLSVATVPLGRRNLDGHSVSLGAVSLVGVGYLSFLYGGVRLPILIWALPLPLTAGLLSRSMRRATFWGLAITAMVGVLSVATALGLPPAPQDPPFWVISLVVVAATWVLFGIVWTYEGSRRSTRAQSEEAEEAVRQRRTLEVISRFAGGVAHEFNNELTVIKTFAGLAADREPDPLLREELFEILRAADRGATLTREILGLSRHITGGLEHVDLGDLLHELASSGRLVEWVGSGVDLVVHAEPGARVVAVKEELADVIMNLLVNARDAQGGRVTVTVRRTAKKVVLEVQDDGAGMDDETRAHAFDPFFTTRPLGQAAGLGLSTALASVRRWGGAIRLVPGPDAGTTVEVTLPPSQG